jgi:hypothetical protein
MRRRRLRGAPRGVQHELDAQRGLHVQQVIERAEADLLGA